MGNLEFDKRVREMLEGHQEMPDSSSWDSIARDLERRRRGRVLYFRRSITAAVAVAASLALLLLLDGPEEVTAPSPLKHDIVVSEKTTVTESAKESLRADAGTSPIHVYKAEKPSQIKVIKNEEITNLAQERVVTPEKEQQAVEEQVKQVDIIKVEPEQKRDETPAGVKERQREAGPGKTGAQSVEEYLFKVRGDSRSTRKHSKALIAMGTNISPSMASNSVTLMGVSQAGGSYNLSNVVSTIQKAYVPLEVVSNTKFLMPVSVGIQVQLPLGEIVSLGSGVNYTLLFSNYDDLSREETRQTHQTLHYIGVPVNVYANLFNNENIRFYLSGGFTVEKGLYAHYKIFENGVKKWSGNSIEGLQWSLNAGAGAEFYVNRNTGLYFDPSVAYFFNNNQPLSIRSAQPLQFKFELGFRFHL
ncbi:MAG: outer membrane beta-barrel protein [Bacteroidales bacterium]|nr:outer membrane beta-barrel protein [Bacteroidales bacterium]